MDESKDKRELCFPVMPVTEPCAVFFKEMRRVLSFLAFTCRAADRVDAIGKSSARELVRLSSMVDGLVNGEQRVAAQKVAKDGTGIVDFVHRTYRRMFGEIMVCRGADAYLNYLSELLALIFRTRPETMKSAETVRVDAVLEHKSMADLIGALAAKKVHDLSYQGMRRLTDHLESKLGLSLFTDAADFEDVVRIIEVRNLIVHNRGVVNEVFMSRVPALGVKRGELVDLGNAVDDVVLLERSVYEVDPRAAVKFQLPQPVVKLEVPENVGWRDWEEKTAKSS